MCHPEDLKSGEYLLVSLQHSQALGTPLAEPLIYPARPAPVLVLNPGIQPVRVGLVPCIIHSEIQKTMSFSPSSMSEKD